MSSQDTRPAELSSDDGIDPWIEFRVHSPAEIGSILKRLRDGSVPVSLNVPGGSAASSTLWAIDSGTGRMSFSVDQDSAPVQRLLEANEAIAVAYLESVKIQFDVRNAMLVRGVRASALQADIPREVFRFQRRDSFRVRTDERMAPRAQLPLKGSDGNGVIGRVLDVSAGGCAMLFSKTAPAFETYQRIPNVRVEIDADTKFACALLVRNMAVVSQGEYTRVGFEWMNMEGSAQRALHRYIDDAQKRRRLLTLG